MKLGVLTNVVGNMSLEDALKYFKSMGIQMVEIGCGGYPGKDHCDPEVLLHDEAKSIRSSAIPSRSMIWKSAHSPATATRSTRIRSWLRLMIRTCATQVLMAEKYGLHQINCFSGCPGDCE